MPLVVLALTLAIIVAWRWYRGWVLSQSDLEFPSYPHPDDHARALIADLRLASKSVRIKCRHCDVDQVSVPLREVLAEEVAAAKRRGVSVHVISHFAPGPESLVSQLRAKELLTLDVAQVQAYSRVIDDRIVLAQADSRSDGDGNLAPQGVSWVRVPFASRNLLANI